MSTPSERVSSAFFEFPDFGFGPVSTSVALLDATRLERDWHVVSTGAALRFCREHMPHLTYHDLDTSAPTGWEAFRAIAPAGSLVVSNTNPEFAAWAVQHGYDVGVVDTLDWMWNELPSELAGARFHLAQTFFGKYRSAAATAGMGVQVVGAILGEDLWPGDQQGRDERHAVIGFGGMRVVFDEELAVRYANWFLETALPLLLASGAADRVTIVGGHPDPTLLPTLWTRDRRLDVRVGMPRARYAALLREAGHALVAPGLATLFECATARLQPFLQPGFSMSMVLQSRQAQRIGYPHLAVWPWLTRIAEALPALPESDGIALIGRQLRRSIENGDPTWLRTRLRAYLGRTNGTPLELPVSDGLPSAQAAFRAAVHTAADARA